MSAATSMAVAEKPRNVFQVPSDEQVIPPGETQQLMVKSDMSGTLLGVMLGPAAKGVKLWSGKESMDVPEDIKSWRPNVSVTAGKFIILTVTNTGDEPAVFRALFLIDAPNHKVVVGEPQAPPPMEEDTIPVAAVPVPISPSRVAAPMGLTQALPPGPTTTPADHNVRPTMNEVAIVLNRNEASNLLEHLRTLHAGSPGSLTANVKHGLMRRLDDALRAKR